MVAGDRRERRPVDALRRDALLRVGALRAQALLVAGARFAPEAIELRLALGVELLDREHGDVAVLGVDPRMRGRGEDDEAGGDQRRREGVGAGSVSASARYLPRAARSSSTKRSTASVSASRG